MSILTTLKTKRFLSVRRSVFVGVRLTKGFSLTSRRMLPLTGAIIIPDLMVLDVPPFALSSVRRLRAFLRESFFFCCYWLYVLLLSLLLVSWLVLPLLLIVVIVRYVC